MVDRAGIIFCALDVFSVDHQREGETEVGAEYVDEHGTTDVCRL